MQIIRVEKKRHIRDFHELPTRLYAGNTLWRPPFYGEVEQVFNPQNNERFRKGGECERFLVLENEKAVGRFALFIDPEKDTRYSPKLGGIGFIEMENNPEIAKAMIEYAKQWHQKRGYSGFRGPVNFGENDTFWGIQTSGFASPNVYGMFYQHSYYQRLVELTDAQKFDDVFMYHRYMESPLPERLLKIAARLKQNPKIEIRPINKKHLQKDGEIIRQIYNNAFYNQRIAEREQEFTGITRETIRTMIKKLKPVLMPQTSPIVFVNGEPASFLVSVPDLHELSAQTGGRLGLRHLPKIISFKKNSTRLRPLAFGTDPRFRGRGLEALIFVQGIEWTRKYYPNIVEMEGGFVSEKNWIMRNSLEALGCTIGTSYRVYKWLDE